MSYPLDRTGRIVERAKLREQVMKRAEVQADRIGRAVHCGGVDGVHNPGGCTNDGTGCLCACHDPGGET